MIQVAQITDRITNEGTVRDIYNSVESGAVNKFDVAVSSEYGEFGMETDGKIHLPFFGYDLDATDFGHGQFAVKLGIPKNYYKELLDERPDILAKCVNHSLQTKKQKFKFRTLRTGDAFVIRAVGSDKYRPIDDVDVLQQLLPYVESSDLVLNQAAFTETNMFLKLLSPKLQGSVRNDDIVQGGVCISNSEVGFGYVSINFFLNRLVCSNGLIRSETQAEIKKKHIGPASLDKDEMFKETPYQSFNDNEFWKGANNLFERVLSEEYFSKVMDQLVETTKREIKNSDFAVLGERLEKFKGIMLTEDESAKVVADLGKVKDFTQWGLLNAITSTAKEAESYNRRVALEVAGDKIMSMDKKEFDRLVK